MICCPSGAITNFQLYLRISFTAFSVSDFWVTGFLLIFAPGGYDEPETLRYAICLICPMGADVR